MAAVFAIGLSVIVCVYENRGELVRSPLNLLQIGKSFLEPWEDFFSRRGAAVILIAIIFFKLGEAMLGAVTTPFYMGLGFSKLKISSIVKLYGFVAATLGTYAGGYLLYKIGYFKGIIISAFAQSITNLSMIWLNNAGANDLVLIATVSMENFTGGMGNTALVSYLSLLCSQEYPATQYALLSSAASLCTNSITIYAGELVSSCGWDLFFILTVLMGIPAVTVFCYSRYQYGELWFAKDKRCTGDNSRGQYKL
jgi:PAT family beta-lactamase induction signal transducer AmpG